jgi:hypothetical protein
LHQQQLFAFAFIVLSPLLLLESSQLAQCTAFITVNKSLITDKPEIPDSDFAWVPPDLAIDSPWFGEWTKNLKDAAATCFGEDPTSVIEEGLTALFEPHCHSSRSKTSAIALVGIST